MGGRGRDEKLLMDGLTTVTFTERESKTVLTIHTRAVGLAPIAARMLAGMNEGWTQSIDRLEAYLACTR